jgi:alkyl hydroperoxide reductase subunit AhpC
MASRVVARDTVCDTPAVLVIGRAGKQVRINELALTIEQALLVVGDLLDTIKAAVLAEVESVVYPANWQEHSAPRVAPRPGDAD